jgi:glycosyltransferase involved in cell wall biosynthesis
MLSIASGGGVATYAHGLGGAMAAALGSVDLVTDRLDAPPRSLTRGFAGALRPGARRLTKVAKPHAFAGFASAWVAPDIFRQAYWRSRMGLGLLRLDHPVPPEIMHWTYPTPLTVVGARNIYTIHDIIPLLRPDLSPINSVRHRRILRHVLASAAHIVTVSEQSRRDLIAVLGCDQDLVSNTYQSVDVEAAAKGRLPAALEAEGYFLFCGSVEPRKNLPRLVEAHRASGVTEPLVIVGPDKWRAAEVARCWAGSPSVIRLGLLDRSTLLAVMSGAKALLFPSLAEGFGLPVAEAMALGAPVMTSDHGALAETAGGAALLVDPTDVAAMAGAIRALSAEPAVRERLRHAGFARAKAFSPSAHADRLAALYGRVLEQPTSGGAMSLTGRS